MLNIVLTKEQTKDLVGIKISNLDKTRYIVKYGNKIELPTEVGANIVVDILDHVDIEKDTIILSKTSGEEITVGM